jgi:hypothetical protein
MSCACDCHKNGNTECFLCHNYHAFEEHEPYGDPWGGPNSQGEEPTMSKDPAAVKLGRKYAQALIQIEELALKCINEHKTSCLEMAAIQEIAESALAKE